MSLAKRIFGKMCTHYTNGDIIIGSAVIGGVGGCIMGANIPNGSWRSIPERMMVATWGTFLGTMTGVIIGTASPLILMSLPAALVSATIDHINENKE